MSNESKSDKDATIVAIAKSLVRHTTWPWGPFVSVGNAMVNGHLHRTCRQTDAAKDNRRPGHGPANPDRGPEMNHASDHRRSKPTHVPDKSRLPACVVGWEALPDEFGDGEQWLVAVAVFDKYAKDGWYYELSVITIHCDEDDFSVTANGDPWGWVVAEVDYAVRVR